MATSYSDKLGSGDRRLLCKLTLTGNYTAPAAQLIDGDTDDGDLHFAAAQPAVNCAFTFDFYGLVLIDEAKFYQSTSVTHGVWEWQGSLNGAAWTPICSFVLGGAANPQIHDGLHVNTTPYQYYRLKGLSGNVSNGSFLFEFEFRSDHTVGDPNTNVRITQDVAEVGIEAALPAVRDTTDVAEVALERDAEHTIVRDTTDAVEAAIETYPAVRVTQEVIECVVTPPKGSVSIVPPLPLPLQQQVFDERFLMTEPWRGFFSGLLTEHPAVSGFMERIGRRFVRRVTARADDPGLPPYPLPMQQPVIDERRLVTLPWAEFFRSLVPKFQGDDPLPLPLQHQVTDDRLLMTVPWAIFFLKLLSARTAGGGDIDEFMPNIVFMDSFDHYNTNDLHAKYALANETEFGGAAIYPGLGRNGTQALGISGQNDNANYLRFGGLAGNTYYLEFGFNPTSNAGAPMPGNQIVAFRDSGITQCELRLMATGQLAVTRNGVMLGQTTGFAYGTNQWRHIGFKVECADAGSVIVTVDSIPKITLTGVDTNNSGFNRITEVVFFSQSNSSTIPSFYDDVIISTDGFCSDSRVGAVFPKGNGFWQQWIQCPNAYTYPLGSGNRVADIAITQNATSPLLSGTLGNMVDGNGASRASCNGIAVDSTKFIRFDFGAALSRHITEVRLYWGNSRAQGTWMWQGSGDGAGWTDLLTAPVTLGPPPPATLSSGGWQTIRLTNGLFYRYYRLRGVDGSPAAAGLNEIYEFEFYIDPGLAPPPLYQNVDEFGSNEDDDYNYSKTAGHRVSYDFGALGLTGTIKGVQHVATMRKDDDRVRIINQFVRVGTTDYDGPDDSVNDTYVAHRKVWVKNPATDAPWEVSEVDSSEWGTELVS